MKSVRFAGRPVGHLAERAERGVVAERERQPGPAPQLLGRVEVGPAGEDRRRPDAVGPVAERGRDARRRRANVGAGDGGAVEHHGQQLARQVERALGVSVDVERGALLGEDPSLAGGDRDPDMAVTEVEAGDEAVRPVQRQQRGRPAAARAGAAASGRRLVDQTLAEQLGDQRGRRAPRQPDRARQLRAADRAVVADHRDQMGAEQRVRRCRGDLGIRGLGHGRRDTRDQPFRLVAGRNRADCCKP